MPKLKEKKQKIVKNEVKEVLEYFELDQIEEYRTLLANLEDRKQRYGFAICKNIDEGLKLRSLLFFIHDIEKAARILGMKPAQLYALRDDFAQEGFFGNLLREQSEALIYTTSRIMNKGDMVADRKLELETAHRAAEIADKYFKRGRILTEQSTSIVENRNKEIYDDENIPIEERIKELERKIVATQTTTVDRVKEEKRA